MKDIARMRLGVLKELKNLKSMINQIEASVKSRDEFAVSRAYIFLKALVYHLNEGDLTPSEIELHHAILVDNERKNESGSDC